ncbi:hypothetical protein [Pelagibius sp. Alg239-R121]|uniref:hypothetical protein n=1 Tax=Pelagibius sp. Alg239-R121 TaxID=2993448 RepID=UPI0024A6ADBA|nr:hypothetical protein [Pelagibius sp. Alg239-R121]
MSDKPKSTGNVLLSFEPDIHDLPGLATSMYMAVQGFSGGDPRQKDGLARLAQVLEEKTQALHDHWREELEEVRRCKSEQPKR